jgi:hypothetical protein
MGLVADLPPVVERYLTERGLAAIPENELAELRRPPVSQGGCPFPLFRGKFGLHHHEYIGEIPREGYEWPLSIVKCVACGNITLEEPIALAAP